MEVLKVICLFLILDSAICHVLRVKQEPEIVSLDDVKKERIHYPRGLDEKLRPKRQIGVEGSDDVILLDSSNGYGLETPSPNGNIPIDTQIATGPNFGNSPGIGANDGVSFPVDTFNSANINAEVNPANSGLINAASFANPYTNGNLGVITTNANAAVNLGFGMPTVDTPAGNNNAGFGQNTGENAGRTNGASFGNDNYQNNPYKNSNNGVVTTNANAAVNLGFGMPTVDTPAGNNNGGPGQNTQSYDKYDSSALSYNKYDPHHYDPHHHYDHEHYDHHHYGHHHYDPHHHWHYQHY